MLNDEDECMTEPPIPQVETHLDQQIGFENVLVVPKSMKVVFQPLDLTPCGKIAISYPQLAQTQSPDEYDEDEQLYSAVNEVASKHKYPNEDISLFTLKSTLYICVPHFVNSITEKLVADAIVLLAESAGLWLLLAPCQLNNGTTIARLDLPDLKFLQVPQLQPPHVVTGVGAAVVSALAKKGLLKRVDTLVLNAEGHPGLEKVDADSVMDAAGEVYRLLGLGDSALDNLSKIVRKLNSANTSGMYI